MDVDSGVSVPYLQQQTQKPHQSTGTAQESPNMAPITEKKETASLSLYVKWLGQKPEQTSKQRNELERALQTWFNKNKNNMSCRDVRITDSSTVLITIEPASSQENLFEEETELTWKDQKILTVKATHPSDPMTRGQTPGSLMDLSSSLTSAAHLVKGQGTAATAGEQNGSYTVPLDHLQYMNRIYRDAVKRIESDNGVQIVCNVKVSFVDPTGGGDPTKALNEFKNLAQLCSHDSNVITVRHEDTDPQDWGKVLKIIRQDQAKLLLTASSHEVTVCGPSQGLHAVQKYLKNTRSAPGNNHIPAGASSLGFQGLSRLESRDLVGPPSLAIDESHWMMMTTAFATQIADIQKKFDVSFEYSTQGKVTARANAKSFEAISLESHALRVLLRLHQRVATSVVSCSMLIPNLEHIVEEKLRVVLSQCPSIVAEVKNDCWRMMGLPENLCQAMCAIEQSLGGPVFKEKDKQRIGYSQLSKSTDRGRGVTGREEEDTCAICMDHFIDKQRLLKCGHEFCKVCLQNSIQSLGHICPLCKDIFGKLEGDQPHGVMKWYRERDCLPGFEGSGLIVITYTFSSGIQTEKHPRPGKPYHGTLRQAYLPDTAEGSQLLRLLKTAFDQKLIFTVGISRTSGNEDQVTWNDIHHKTQIQGGPERFGYPDPGYLRRLREELKAKGIE